MALLLAVLVLSGWAQAEFQPQDADEREAFRIYQEYRKCRSDEERLEAVIKQKFGDALMGAAGYYAILGADREASAEVKLRRAEVDGLRRRENELIAAWEGKFYWRYGDLRWATEHLKDPKTGQTMDRIEFALTYFRFHRESPGTTSGGDFVAEKGGGDSWSHLRVGLSNVGQFRTEDRSGWRNNGTGFNATAGKGPVSLRLDVSGKGGVSYADYQLKASAQTGSGKQLLAESSTLSKDGGSRSLSLQWDPSRDPGPLSVNLSLSGGNPEGFTYFVAGKIDSPGSKASTAPVQTSPSVAPTTLYNNGNDLAVNNGGQPALIELATPVTLTEIIHYHWNDGKGSPAGTISLRDAGGKVFGPWQASLRNGVYWEVHPGLTLPAGRYTVLDSDPGSWSQNAATGGRGIVIWKGVPAR